MWCVGPWYCYRLCGVVVVVSLVCIGWVACGIGDLCCVVVCLSVFDLFVGCVVSI